MRDVSDIFKQLLDSKALQKDITITVKLKNNSQKKKHSIKKTPKQSSRHQSRRLPPPPPPPPPLKKTTPIKPDKSMTFVNEMKNMIKRGRLKKINNN